MVKFFWGIFGEFWSEFFIEILWKFYKNFGDFL